MVIAAIINPSMRPRTLIVVIACLGQWLPCVLARVMGQGQGQGQASRALIVRDDAPKTSDFLRRVFPVGEFQGSPAQLYQRGIDLCS